MANVYADIADVKARFSFGTQDESTIDSRLQAHLEYASADLETMCGSPLYPRYFISYDDVLTFRCPRDRRLNIPDLLTVNSVTVDDVVLTVDDYDLSPMNAKPHVHIQSDKIDHQSTVIIDGTWGYSAIASSLVKDATIILTIWRYKREEIAYQDVGGNDEFGIAAHAKYPFEVQHFVKIHKRNTPID